MVQNFDGERLASALANVPEPLQVAYAMLIAERLYPALLAYSRETGGEEAWRLRQLLDEMWQGLRDGALRPDWVKAAADEVYALRPETEDNPSSIASYALDATAAAWEAMQSAITHDLSHVVEAAQIAFESIYLSEEQRSGLSPQDRADQAAILTSKGVAQELQTQEEQLRRAQSFNTNPLQGISVLRQEYGHPEKSIHGLS